MSEIKSEVYIGKNGVGKSKYLKQLNKKDPNSFLISFSNNWNVPDGFKKNFHKADAFKDYRKFAEKIFSVPIEIKDDCKEMIEKKKKKDFNFSKLNDSFDDLAKDYFLQGLVTAKNLKKFIKEGDEKKIEHSLVSFDDKLKIDEDYGSGKFVYFMIKFMYICLENLLTNNSEKKYTLIIDEPEAFLHPGLIREVAFMLRKVNKKINVIVATHSSDFLQYFCTNETNIHFLTVEFEKTTPKTLEKKNFKKKHFKELEEINIFNKKKIFLSLMSSKIIFVEGENDLKLIEYILYTDEELKFTKDIFIWSCKGKWNIIDAIEFAESTGRFSPEDAFFILYDKDKSLGDKKNKILRKTTILAEWNSLKIKSDKDFKSNLIENKKPKHIHEFEKKIEKLQSYFFEFNLEKYFKWEGGKYKFNPYDFFLGQENKKKLNKFMEDSGLENFFKKKL